MNLEQVIHQRWAGDATLEGLLPVARLKTGRSVGETVPYATLARRRCRTRFRTNAGDAVDEVRLRIHLWHDDYDAGRTILEAIKAAFDRSSFPLAEGDQVVQMRRTDDAAEQDDEGLWRFAIEFAVEVYLPEGA